MSNQVVGRRQHLWAHILWSGHYRYQCNTFQLKIHLPHEKALFLASRILFYHQQNKNKDPNKKGRRSRRSTILTLGNKIPIDNPWLHSTKKLQEKHPIGQVLVLNKRVAGNSEALKLKICHLMKERIRSYLKTLHLIFFSLRSSLWHSPNLGCPHQ